MLSYSAGQNGTLRAKLHDLWDEHVALTRMVIISFYADLPDLSAAEARLIQNQDAIAAALKPYAGSGAADMLAALLRTHIIRAADVLKATRAPNPLALAAAQTAWKQNADAIAHALAPVLGLSETSVLRPVLRTHLAQTTAEALARLRGDWQADLAAYDVARAHMLRFADLMADRIGSFFYPPETTLAAGFAPNAHRVSRLGSRFHRSK